MRLRTITALDMQDAMRMVRDSIGEDAVIISSSPDPQGKGVNVTVATEDLDPVAVPLPPTVEKLPERKVTALQPRAVESSRSEPTSILREIEKLMRFHGAPDYLVSKLVETARYINFEPALSADGMRNAIRKVLDAAFQYAPLALDEPSFRFMVVGPPGIGKTMTVAKIAAQIVMDKKKVTVITTDNKRAGGVEQLSAFTSILGLELKVAGTRGELRRALQECPIPTRVLIDTAGTNPYDMAELKELSEFVGFEDIEPILATAAGADSSEAEDITRAFIFLGVRKLLVTRVDTARRFGSILTAANAGGLAFCNVSSTSKVIGEFRKMDAAYLTQLLMQHHG